MDAHRGEPVSNAAPSNLHQIIVKNLIVTLTIRERGLGAPWMVLPSFGGRVSDTDRPEPDEVIVFARDDGFEGRKVRLLNAEIDLHSLGVSLPVAAIYRDTGLIA